MRGKLPIVVTWLVFASLQIRANDYVQPREVPSDKQTPLPGTEKLSLEGDIASQMIDGIDRFLLRKLDESVEKRGRHWNRDFSSAEAYSRSIEPNRKRLAHILGMRDPRVSFEAPELVGTIKDSALIAKGKNYEIFAIRWPVLSDPGPAMSNAVCVFGEGLLAVPSGDRRSTASVIVMPDADQTPEQWFGIEDGLSSESQVARRLAESGCRVVVPTLVSRDLKQYRGAKLTNREFLYRPAFELGRHLIGYELHKVLAIVDWFEKEAGDSDPSIGIIGYGEGGGLALYVSALDKRIDATCVSAYFDNRNDVWRQPIDRNVFGLLDQFGDAELASMIAPRALYVSNATAPALELPGNGGAPARLTHPADDVVMAEFRRASELVAPFRGKVHWPARASGRTFPGPKARPEDKGAPRAILGMLTLDSWLAQLNPPAKLAEPGEPPKVLRKIDAAARQSRQVAEIDRFNQLLLIESPYTRAEFAKKLDTSSIEAYEKSVEWYREFFATEVIGRFDDKLVPPNPRARLVYETDHWKCFEVVLDVWPDVIAYGLLLVPTDLTDGERRPVVVCQHGLEGRPQDTIGPQGSEHYSAFAGRLAEQGFVTFAPQNIYIFRDRFRSLQRKANPLGKTLFSIMVPQHQQITDWLRSLPFVDGERIAFYGLSYGGKSAMRIPPLVKNYCLSICSADFNEWVWKNASSRSPYSYVDKGEYEIFEFDLGSTFNYSEMAALIAPRPFMVERGHFDTVAPDETVAYEFGKVRNLYNARLKLPPDRCRIEWFVGPHKINAVETFEFLQHHLNRPKPSVP
jgi:dienelactone hydrolase